MIHHELQEACAITDFQGLGEVEHLLCRSLGLDLFQRQSDCLRKSTSGLDFRSLIRSLKLYSVGPVTEASRADPLPSPS